jgi:hypothetical protein
MLLLLSLRSKPLKRCALANFDYAPAARYAA